MSRKGPTIRFELQKWRRNSQLAEIWVEDPAAGWIDRCSAASTDGAARHYPSYPGLRFDRRDADYGGARGSCANRLIIHAYPTLSEMFQEAALTGSGQAIHIETSVAHPSTARKAGGHYECGVCTRTSVCASGMHFGDFSLPIWSCMVLENPRCGSSVALNSSVGPSFIGSIVDKIDK